MNSVKGLIKILTLHSIKDLTIILLLRIIEILRIVEIMIHQIIIDHKVIDSLINGKVDQGLLKNRIVGNSNQNTIIQHTKSNHQLTFQTMDLHSDQQEHQIERILHLKFQLALQCLWVPKVQH